MSGRCQGTHRHLFTVHRHPDWPCHPRPASLHGHVWWRHPNHDGVIYVQLYADTRQFAAAMRKLAAEAERFAASNRERDARDLRYFEWRLWLADQYREAMDTVDRIMRGETAG